MTRARHITAEKTPSYMTDPKVPERIKKEFPNIQILFLLCEPGARAYSDFKYLHRTKLQTKPDHPRHTQIKEKFISLNIWTCTRSTGGSRGRSSVNPFFRLMYVICNFK